MYTCFKNFTGASGRISRPAGRVDNHNKLGEAVDVVAKQLWHALQNTDADGAKVIVEQLEVGKLQKCV